MEMKAAMWLALAVALTTAACGSDPSEPSEPSPIDAAPDQQTAIRLGKIACLRSEAAFDETFPKCAWQIVTYPEGWSLTCGYANLSKESSDSHMAPAYSFSVERKDGAVTGCTIYR
jgi:hypothetical protein